MLALYQAPDRPWFQANLTASGSGVLQADWSIQLPPNLEGLYEVDLRAWDTLGNHDIIPNFWRGVIDTTAPRLDLSALAMYLPSYRPDPAKQDWWVSVAYHCSAHDMFLDESTYQCPGSSLPPPSRTFVDDPTLLDLFPGLALVNELTLKWAQWQPAGPHPASMRACDRWGNCATSSINPDFLPVTHPGPMAVITSPNDGAIITASSVNVGIHAFTNQESEPSWLKQVELRMDGLVVDSHDFPAGTVAETAYLVNVPVTAGEHILSAEAKDWDGSTQLMTAIISIQVDPDPPQVAISNDKITEANRYQKGSSVLIFFGTASDTECLASVKLSVNGEPFEAAVYDPDLNTWEIAYYVNAPEGKTLTARARATDCGGLTSEVTKLIPTDLTLPAAQAPDTLIDTRPTNPGYPVNVTFTFRGIKHEKEIAVLMCQLDKEAYQPCSSPLTYATIKTGNHTFSVRAVDVEGNVDPTPATYSWTVVNEPVFIWLPILSKP